MYLLLFNKIDFIVIKMLIEVESFMSLFIFTEYDTFDSDDDEDDCDDDTCIDDGDDDEFHNNDHWISIKDNIHNDDND